MRRISFEDQSHDIIIITLYHIVSARMQRECLAVRLVDAVICGCVGVNFFNKLLFVSLTPVLRLRLNAASSRRSPKKSASAIKTASASTKRTTTIFIDADAENYGNQTNMTIVVWFNA